MQSKKYFFTFFVKIKHHCNKRVQLIALLFIIVFTFCYNIYSDSQKIDVTNTRDSQKFYVANGYTSREAYIAHGGGIDKYTYTNTLEAVTDSIEKGFKFIEIDMIITSDGYIVGGHDWKHLKEIAGIQNADDEPLSLTEVKNLKL